MLCKIYSGYCTLSAINCVEGVTVKEFCLMLFKRLVDSALPIGDVVGLY